MTSLPLPALTDTLDFFKSRRKYIFFALFFTFSVGTLFNFVETRWLITFDEQHERCLPYSVWLIHKGVAPKRGDYVSFRIRSVPYRKDGEMWAKVLTGVEGDRLEVRKVLDQDRRRLPGLYRETVYRNGMPITVDIQGYVLIFKSGSLSPESFRALAHDTHNHPMPIAASQVIPHGKYFVTTPNQRSYDSRYWGLVDEKDIVGKATPLI